MTEMKPNRFLAYWQPVLDALRSADPKPMRPAEVVAWIRERVVIEGDALTRIVKNGQQSIFENDIHWARFYLSKAGLLITPRRGYWALSPDGRKANLTKSDIWNLYVPIRDASRRGTDKVEEEEPAPDTGDDNDDETGPTYWFVGASWGGKKNDRTADFLAKGVWENGYDDKFTDAVRRVRTGDRIAIKSTFVQKKGTPFDVGGKPVSVMRIKATGTVLENMGDGKTLRVAWDPTPENRDWFFYTYRTTIIKANTEDECAKKLIDFAFRGISQDYSWFIKQPYWSEQYGIEAKEDSTGFYTEPEAVTDIDIMEVDEIPAYTLGNIVEDGCFLSRDELGGIWERWISKKNLILQGPPGTGKTWLAKRLGFALVGSNDRETCRSRLRVVQFHPSLAYEDFVRGWRPSGEGRLSLVDGILLQAIDAAAAEPDRPFVLVIEEINRGNPAQILGEMLTLLDNTKRKPSEAIELAYRKAPGERVYIPGNLYIIGTMNVADRSLAIVDLALRRRFAFVDLEPRFGPVWKAWCVKRGLDTSLANEIETRVAALNLDISTSASLGPQFRIGHSYVTPDADEVIQDGVAWFRRIIDTEVGPLLEEYWYDAPDKSRDAKERLLARLS